jgi:hypothetical protein
VDRLIQELVTLEDEATARAAATVAGWSGVGWDDRFLCYDGPIESLRLLEDASFQQSMAEALDEAEYRPRLARPDSLGDRADEGYRVVHITDQKSWRRRITKGDVVLIARPLRWELKIEGAEGILPIEDRTVRLDAGALATYQGADPNQKCRFRRYVTASPRREYDEQSVREAIL